MLGALPEPQAPATRPAGPGRGLGEALRDAVRAKDVRRAEAVFADASAVSADEALNDVLYAVHDHTEVHRVVLPYRAWDLLGLVGREQAQTLLRQSVRYCLKAESWSHDGAYDEPRDLLPRVMERYHLLDQGGGQRPAGAGPPKTSGSRKPR